MESITAYLEDQTTKSLLYSTFALLTFYIIFNVQILPKPIPGFDLAGKEDGDWSLLPAQKRYATTGKTLILEGLKKFHGRIFQVIGHAGAVLILPPKYIHEIRNNPHLNLHGTAENDFFVRYPAFKAMATGAEDDVILKMVNKKLTTSLALITEPVNEENTIAMAEHWPVAKDWTATPFVERSMLLVSQVSSRIFLGAPVCRDPRWIKIAKDYTIQLMVGAYVMRAIPSVLRPVLYWVLPPIWQLQNTVWTARKIITPEIDRRRRERAQALERGEKILKRLDSIDWLEDLTSPNFDFVGGQLSLSFVAIHTTSNTLAHLLYDLIDNPELIPELRQEMIAAIREDGGFTKTTLYKMRLLDSIMKESQRINVLANVIMQRHCHEEVKLSDGTVIPKGVRVLVSTTHMHDEEYYPDPLRFDGKRWLRLRDQPGNQNRFQFVTTTPEHIGFGHGEHSCPGRFFASNEIKVIICHLLLKYDWAFKDGKRPEKLCYGQEFALDSKAEIMYRSRESEIDFANIEVSA